MSLDSGFDFGEEAVVLVNIWAGSEGTVRSRSGIALGGGPQAMTQTSSSTPNECEEDDKDAQTSKVSRKNEWFAPETISDRCQ